MASKTEAYLSEIRAMQGLKNAILSPHMGWASEEAGWEIRESILSDIISASQGKSARCVVNEIKTLAR